MLRSKRQKYRLEKCALCSRPREDARHVRYGADENNPRKHHYTTTAGSSLLPTCACSRTCWVCAALRDELKRLRGKLRKRPGKVLGAECPKYRDCRRVEGREVRR